MGFFTHLNSLLESNHKHKTESNHKTKQLETFYDMLRKLSKQIAYTPAIKLIGDHQSISNEYCFIHNLTIATDIDWYVFDTLYGFFNEMSCVFTSKLRNHIDDFYHLLPEHLHQDKRLLAVCNSFIKQPRLYIHKDMIRDMAKLKNIQVDKIAKKKTNNRLYSIMLQAYRDHMRDNVNELRKVIADIVAESTQKTESIRLLQAIKNYNKEYYLAYLCPNNM